MKCKHCGAELNENSKFCMNCGSQVSTNDENATTEKTQYASGILQYSNNQKPSNQQAAPVLSESKPHKPWYKRWWIWLLMGLGTIVLLFNMTCTCAIIMPSSSSGSSSNTKITESNNSAVIKETTSTEKATEKATESPKEIEEAFKSSCTEIDYKTLSRNPDKYKGDNFVITGEVIQVLESDSWFNDTTTLRINITKEELEYLDEPLWSDPIIATVTIPNGEDRILEDDIITFWGTCDGLYTYQSILGQSISVPKIDIEYYQIES